MKKEYDEYLTNKYPKIFSQRSGDPMKTAMCWGFECGDGWFNILNSLCAAIQSHIDHSNGKVSQVEATQIKEKFGDLRFYYVGGDEVISNYVSFAEIMSTKTCEECGKIGKTLGSGWIRTLCKEHAYLKKQSWNDEFPEIGL